MNNDIRTVPLARKLNRKGVEGARNDNIPKN